MLWSIESGDDVQLFASQDDLYTPWSGLYQLPPGTDDERVTSQRYC